MKMQFRSVGCDQLLLCFFKKAGCTYSRLKCLEESFETLPFWFPHYERAAVS